MDSNKGNKEMARGTSKQTDDLNVKDVDRAAEVGQVLKDLQFPADKNQIIQFAQKATQDEGVLSQLRRIDERQYENVSEVTKAAGLVQPKS